MNSQASAKRCICVQVLVPGRGKPVPHKGSLSAAAVKAFALQQLPNTVLTLRKPEDLQALLHACGAAGSSNSSRGGGGGKAPQQARWNLCVVLVLEKADAPPLLRSIALQHQGHVRV
jgi:hypothetical protein